MTKICHYGLLEIKQREWEISICLYQYLYLHLCIFSFLVFTSRSGHCGQKRELCQWNSLQREIKKPLLLHLSLNIISISYEQEGSIKLVRWGTRAEPVYYFFFSETVEIVSLFFPVPSSVKWSRCLGSSLRSLCPAPTVSSSTFLLFQVCFIWGQLKGTLKHKEQRLL